MVMNKQIESQILDELLNFKVPIIPKQTRFWMIRTQKGYFYDEFLAKKFVALAWNNIDATTNLSESSKESLKDDIMLKFPEINRPSTVINKCYNFINEVHEGDILVIPSKGSKYITFAIAGEYYEDSTKTVEIEKTVIYRIKNNDVDIHDVSCPYKKRRKITLLRTIKSEDINISLYRAISNYHGISNFDAYAYQILNELYNCYTFQHYTVLVYNIRKTAPIKPRELSHLICGNIDSLCSIISEDRISTKMDLHSPGDVIYMLQEAYDFAKDNWSVIFGLLIFLGGGSALSFKVPGLIDIVKNIISVPEDLRSKRLDNDSKELDIQLKRLELKQKLKDSGINPESLLSPMENIVKSTTSLQTEPIILSEESAITSVTNDEDEESIDIEDE